MDTDALPAVAAGGYFNTGSLGPLCAAGQAAFLAMLQEEFAAGRIRPESSQAAMRVRTEARSAAAGLLGAGADEIALQPHTSEGVNAFAWGVAWRPGDAVLISDEEHQGATVAVGALRQRFGLEVRVFAAARAAAEVARLLALGRVRLVVLSHVSYATGRVLPLAEVAALAHDHGALVLVDGAQAAGALEADVGALGVDGYAVPGQKWLLGPEGTGALYVRRDRLHALSPAFAGWASAGASDAAGSFVPVPGAPRFEVGTICTPAFAAWTAGLEWVRSTVGWPEAFARTRERAERLRRALLAMPQVEVLTPDDHAGLVSFQVEGRRPAAVVHDLQQRGFTVRSIPRPACVRASVGWFHADAEVDALAAAIEAVRSAE